MGFRQGAYAKVWSTDDKGNYSVGNISISKKNKETNKYETEFQDGFVRFVGTAHDTIKGLQIPENGTSIKITSCDVTNKYDAENKKSYTNFVIFGFDIADGGSTESKPDKKSKNTSKGKTKSAPEADTDIDEDDLPF